MAIFEITHQALSALTPTTFSAHGLREREDLQRLLRDQIDLIAPETMVLAEEYGSFEGSLRRIDLLGLDKDCRLVVIELKRTGDGGHMELQALRYAAMVSSMTFDQAVAAHREFLARVRPGEQIDAEAQILRFLEVGAVADTPPQISQAVRIVLAAADFSTEITTTVLWLNSSGLDISCVRLAPYAAGDGRVLLDIQQVIPLRKAADYQIAIRDKAAAVDAQRSKQMREAIAKFELFIGETKYPRLTKRELMYRFIAEAISRGVTPLQLRQKITWRAGTLFFDVPGELDSAAVFRAIEDSATKEPRHFFLQDDQLFHGDGRTWALTNQWGHRADEAIGKIMELLGNPKDIRYAIAVTDLPG